MKVKQIFIAFLLGVVFTVTIGATSVFQFTLSPDTLYVDGVRIDKTLFKYEGSNYLPLRATAEALGAEVQYDNKRIDITSIKPSTVQDVAKQADNCVYIACMKDATQKATASGVLVGNNYILTNKHVISDYGVNKWIAEGNKSVFDRYYCTETKTFETKADIALIRTDRPHGGNIKIGDSSKLKVGDEIVVISSPRGIKNVVMHGRITKLYSSNLVNYICTDVETKPGSSGGGMFNMHGELIGLMVGSPSIEDDKISIGIAIDSIKGFIE